jgi:hypothetical protein
LARAIDVRWEFHNPWHPPSLGKVEKNESDLKKATNEASS